LAGGWRPSVSTSVDLCKRVRFRQSDCETCLEVCPEGAISLSPGPRISNACSECGLCQAACPTEVFRERHYSDDRLLAGLISTSRVGSPATAKGKALAHCERAEAPAGRSVRIPCLGLLSDRVLVATALAGVEEVRLIRGRCAECRLRPGKELLDSAVRSSIVMLESLGLAGVSIDLEVKERTGGRRLARREIFSILSGRQGAGDPAGAPARDMAVPERASDEPDRRPRSREGVSASRRRRFLRRSLDEHGLGGRDVAYEKGLPWGRLRIDEHLCTACGVCAAVCPTGAVDQVPEDEDQVLLFRRSDCTNCSLCEEACPEAAVEFEERIHLADILDDRWRVAARIQMSWCTFCGETLPHGEGNVCPTCAKRRVGASWAGGWQ
jgi:ferredoxin